MHVLVLFYNIGPYHLARLEQTRTILEGKGGRLSAIQVTAQTAEHPWGTVEIPQYVTTLLDHQDGKDPRLDSPKLLFDALNRLRPDAVAIPGWGFDFARCALKWCRRNRIRRVLMSDSHYADTPRTWWKEKVKWWLAVRHFGSALVAGSLAADYLKRLGFPPQRIFIGFDVVDNESFSTDVDAARQAFQTRPCPAPVRYFLASSRFIPRKNLVRLIEAFSKARTALGESLPQHLVILGDGPMKPELLKKIDACELNGVVHLPGFVSRDQLIPWLAFADGFIHPALHEQWGLVVNEAMAAALPIALSRRCGCSPELLVEGVTGFGFDPESTESIAEAIESLVELGECRREMGLAGRTHVNDILPTRRFADGLIEAVQWAEV